MLRFADVQHRATPASRRAGLLAEFAQVLADRGMASIEEFGDMLDWPLPRRDGMSRHFHVFHPDMCSFSDAFRGTIHYHGGAVSGTILHGAVEHITYDPAPDPAGDRRLGDARYRLTPTRRRHDAGTTYTLPARVPHWIKPLGLTLTYFEEEDNDELGELIDPADPAIGHDEQPLEQPDVEAWMSELLALVPTQVA